MLKAINSICIVSMLLAGMTSHAQSRKISKQKNQSPTCGQCFTPPRFPGGDSTLQEYLRRHTRYPNPARELEVEGTVRLEFFINEEGQPEDIRIIRDVSAGCSQEAIRVLKNMPPWIAGTYNGRKIRMLYALPVRFQLRH